MWRGPCARYSIRGRSRHILVIVCRRHATNGSLHLRLCYTCRQFLEPFHALDRALDALHRLTDLLYRPTASGERRQVATPTGCGVPAASCRHRRQSLEPRRASSAFASALRTHAQPATWITSDGPPQGRCARPSVSIDWPGVSAMLERGCQVRDALMVDGSPLPSLPGLPDKQSPPTTARPCPGPRA